MKSLIVKDEVLLGEMTEALIAGQKVRFPGIGTLTVRDRKERVYNSPMTGGKDIIVPAHKKVSFAPDKVFKGVLAQ